MKGTDKTKKINKIIRLCDNYLVNFILIQSNYPKFSLILLNYYDYKYYKLIIY